MAIGLKLVPDGLVGLGDVFLERGNEMQEHPRALDVAEEPVADANALVGALDQAGNIGEHEFAAVDGGYAEVRVQRGEGIIGDLRTRPGDGGEEGRLAGIGQADQAGVGDQLEPEPDGLLLALETRIGMARGLVGGGLEMGVAEAAIAADGEAVALADLGQVADQRLVVFLEDLRSCGHFQGDAVATGAGAVAAHAVAAGLGLEMLLEAVVDQRVEPVDGCHPDITAAATIAAVGSAELDVFLAPERDATGATVAGADIDLGFVEEFHLAVPIGL